MAIVNFRIKKLSGERSDITAKEVSNVSVSSNFTILSADKRKDETAGDYLLVNFHFNVRYEPDLGKIDMDGYLWYKDDNINKVVTEKAGKVEIASEPLKEISTTILRDSILEAVDLTRKLKLPIPLNMPKVNVKPKEVRFPKAG